MRFFPLATLALVSILTLPARAVTVYTLDRTQTARFGSGPFGTVTLAQNGLNEVDVTVQLAPGYEFAQTGGPHDAFTFNLPGLSGYVVSDIVASPSSSKTYSWDSGGSNPAFGTFSDSLNCGDCRRGARGAFATELSFTITNAGGILKRDFAANSKGFFFTADILQLSNGATGAVGAVPEPHTAALMFAGLVGIGAYRRRLKV